MKAIEKENLLNEYIKNHENNTCNCEHENMELCLGGIYMNNGMTKEEIFQDW